MGTTLLLPQGSNHPLSPWTQVAGQQERATTINKFQSLFHLEETK